MAAFPLRSKPLPPAQLMAQLETMQVRFESLTEHIDTSTAGGRMQLNVFATLAEYERELNREREPWPAWRPPAHGDAKGVESRR
jgi:hypothetical protein